MIHSRCVLVAVVLVVRARAPRGVAPGPSVGGRCGIVRGIFLSRARRASKTVPDASKSRVLAVSSLSAGFDARERASSAREGRNSLERGRLARERGSTRPSERSFVVVAV